jgi:hypothetical protein
MVGGGEWVFLHIRYKTTNTLFKVVVCVECLFSRSPSRAPYRTPQRAPKGRPTRTPPPVVHDPESIDAQTAYRCRHSAIAQVVSGPNCFQALGSSPSLLQSRMLCKGGPQ